MTTRLAWAWIVFLVVFCPCVARVCAPVAAIYVPFVYVVGGVFAAISVAPFYVTSSVYAVATAALVRICLGMWPNEGRFFLTVMLCGATGLIVSGAISRLLVVSQDASPKKYQLSISTLLLSVLAFAVCIACAIDAWNVWNAWIIQAAPRYFGGPPVGFDQAWTGVAFGVQAACGAIPAVVARGTLKRSVLVALSFSAMSSVVYLHYSGLLYDPPPIYANIVRFCSLVAVMMLFWSVVAGTLWSLEACCCSMGDPLVRRARDARSLETHSLPPTTVK